jgi:hypothetical protein
MDFYYAQLRPSHGDIRLDPVYDEANDRVMQLLRSNRK